MTPPRSPRRKSTDTPSHGPLWQYGRVLTKITETGQYAVSGGRGTRLATAPRDRVINIGQRVPYSRENERNQWRIDVPPPEGVTEYFSIMVEDWDAESNVNQWVYRTYPVNEFGVGTPVDGPTINTIPDDDMPLGAVHPNGSYVALMDAQGPIPPDYDHRNYVIRLHAWDPVTKCFDPVGFAELDVEATFGAASAPLNGDINQFGDLLIGQIAPDYGTIAIIPTSLAGFGAPYDIPAAIPATASSRGWRNMQWHPSGGAFSLNHWDTGPTVWTFEHGVGVGTHYDDPPVSAEDAINYPLQDWDSWGMYSLRWSPDGTHALYYSNGTGKLPFWGVWPFDLVTGFGPMLAGPFDDITDGGGGGPPNFGDLLPNHIAGMDAFNDLNNTHLFATGSEVSDDFETSGALLIDVHPYAGGAIEELTQTQMYPWYHAFTWDPTARLSPSGKYLCNLTEWGWGIFRVDPTTSVLTIHGPTWLGSYSGTDGPQMTWRPLE